MRSDSPSGDSATPSRDSDGPGRDSDGSGRDSDGSGRDSDFPDNNDVRVSGQLSRQEAAAVLDLVQHAAEEDGVSPLSEHVLLHLRYGGDPRARNVLLW